jgi:hypothetical protein
MGAIEYLWMPRTDRLRMLQKRDVLKIHLAKNLLATATSRIRNDLVAKIDFCHFILPVRRSVGVVLTSTTFHFSLSMD